MSLRTIGVYAIDHDNNDIGDITTRNHAETTVSRIVSTTSGVYSFPTGHRTYVVEFHVKIAGTFGLVTFSWASPITLCLDPL